MQRKSRREVCNIQNSEDMGMASILHVEVLPTFVYVMLQVAIRTTGGQQPSQRAYQLRGLIAG